MTSSNQDQDLEPTTRALISLIAGLLLSATVIWTLQFGPAVADQPEVSQPSPVGTTTVSVAKVTFEQEPVDATIEPMDERTARGIDQPLPGDEQRADWALGQFESAGLDLHDLEIRFSSQLEPCRGNAGLHQFDGEVHIVSICSGYEARRAHTLLHELAHAWASQNLDDATRSAFLAARGLSIWHDTDVAWEQRGTEHAAEIIAWGISDNPCWWGVRTSIDQHDAEALASQFALLTGLEPRCDADAARPDQTHRQVVD